MRDLHTILHAAYNLITLFFDLSDVMLKPRLALRGVDQYIAVFQFEICRKLRIDLRIQLRRLRLRQINAKLNPRRESGSAHSNDTGFFHHGKLVVLVLYLDRHKLFLLLLVRLDDDSVFQNLFHYAVNAGKDVSPESRRCRNLRTFFYFVPSFYDCRARRSDMLTQQNLYIFHCHTSPF